MASKFSVAINFAAGGALCRMLVLGRGRAERIGGSGVWMEGLGTVDASSGVVCLVAGVGCWVCGRESVAVIHGREMQYLLYNTPYPPSNAYPFGGNTQ